MPEAVCLPPKTSKTSPPRSCSRSSTNDYSVLKKFKGLSSLPTYLTVIARRTCVKELIKRHREEELGHTNAHRAFVDDGASDEVEAIVSAEEVEKMLEDLSDREAEVIRLYHLKFMNYRDIAKQLGIPENSVGPILAKARKKLREAAEHQQKRELDSLARTVTSSDRRPRE